jgi:hypothetical protein
MYPDSMTLDPKNWVRKCVRHDEASRKEGQVLCMVQQVGEKKTYNRLYGRQLSWKKIVSFQ